MWSSTETPVASTPSVSVRVMVYRRTSPGSGSPPFLSSTDLVDVDRLEWRTAVSCPVELVALFGQTPLSATSQTLNTRVEVVGSLTSARLTRVAGALLAMSTTSVMGGKVRDVVRSCSEVVSQVTTWPTAEQFQPE